VRNPMGNSRYLDDKEEAVADKKEVVIYTTQT
jgi:hypothetical protein